MTEVFSDIPLWTLLIWAGVSFGLAWLLYRRKSWVKDISKARQIILITLRTLGLFLIGILLLGILIKGLDKEIDQPYIITIIDDSQSMLNYADSLDVLSQAKEFLESSNSSFQDKYNVLSYALDESIKNVDSLVFANLKTNLSNSLNQIYETYYGRNIGAIILLSDGNFNSGITPLLAAEKFRRTPIYTMSVGDTIQKVDHLIESIITNEITFLGNKFPVEVSVEGNKTANQSFNIKLYQDGKLIDSKVLKHQESEYSLLKTEFLLEAKTVGIHEYNIKIDHLDNEFNFENNEKSFFIEVLDDRSKVLIVEEALNPDLGAIRSALISENNLEVINHSINEIPDDLKDFNLIIWGDPGAGRDQAAFDKLNNSILPKWFLISPQVTNNDISKLNLQASFNISGQMDMVNSAFNQNFNLFQLSSTARRAIDNFPPIRAHYGNVKYGSNNEILAFQKVGNVVKHDPLFYFTTFQNQKMSITYGTGLWSWRIADYQMNQTHDNFNELVKKTVQYLIVKENTSRLRVNLPSIANSDEEFIMGASFYNESYEPIVEPTIQLHLTKPNGESFDYSFLPLESEYTLNLGKLPAGKYNWKALTSYNGKEFSKEGSFAVRDLELEKLSTKANHQLLVQMAENHDGKFAMLSDYRTIIDEINGREDILPVVYESNTYQRLIDYFWLLFLIVSLFAAEWVIRRYSGGY